MFGSCIRHGRRAIAKGSIKSRATRRTNCALAFARIQRYFHFDRSKCEPTVRNRRRRARRCSVFVRSNWISSARPRAHHRTAKRRHSGRVIISHFGRSKTSDSALQGLYWVLLSAYALKVQLFINELWPRPECASAHCGRCEMSGRDAMHPIP